MEKRKFDYKTSQVIQGNFKLSKLNLMLVFQVNCPGCFLNAIPKALKVHEYFKEDSNFKLLGLSAAFEDFELNNIENTKKLVNDRQLTGVTKNALKKEGYDILSFKIPFDVAFDYMDNKSKSTYTFEKNHMQGTPSWILFTENEVLGQTFGHIDENKMIEAINNGLTYLRN